MTLPPLKSLMSLPSHGTIKHVVPWKNRQEFELVYKDLYNEDETCQRNAINRIATWKSRVGIKLSVAIESSATMQQVLLDGSDAKAFGLLTAREDQLKASSSLALIRFVNHVTEKAQTKATAQPVHLIAREFGIPEWIVRLRHEATHGALPCLDVLMTGVQWASNYLKENFWRQQLEDEQKYSEEETEKPVKTNKLSAIRASLYDYQKARYQEQSEGDKDQSVDSPNSPNVNNVLGTLNSYLNQNRLKFMKCFLEDGIFVSTEEQLAVFGVQAEDLLEHSPPIVAVEVAIFWGPLLRKLYSRGDLPFLMETALLSVGTESNLRNYQLVAWLIHLLAQSAGPTLKGKRKKRRRADDLVKGPLHIPKKTLLATCLQKITPYTIHLLKYLADKESLGSEVFEKLSKLLHMNTQADDSIADEEDLSSSESDTIYTVEDLKREKLQRHETSEPSATVEDVENSLEKNDVHWNICTDIVDWSMVPFGVLPDLSKEDDTDDEAEEEADESKEDLNDNTKEVSYSDENTKDNATEHSTPKKKRHLNSEKDGDSISPKRSVYTPKVEVL